MPYSDNPTVARFKTDMQEIRKSLAGSLEDTYLRQADELIDNMRGTVPVLKGALRDSIRKKDVTQTYGQDFQRVSILVLAGGPTTTKNGYDYAVGTEFGTMKEKAEPFFYSSARLYAQAGRESAQETVDEAIEENNRVRALRTENYSNAGVAVSYGGRGGAMAIP